MLTIRDIRHPFSTSFLGLGLTLTTSYLNKRLRSRNTPDPEHLLEPTHVDNGDVPFASFIEFRSLSTRANQVRAPSREIRRNDYAWKRGSGRVLVLFGKKVSRRR